MRPTRRKSLVVTSTLLLTASSQVNCFTISSRKPTSTHARHDGFTFLGVQNHPHNNNKSNRYNVYHNHMIQPASSSMLNMKSDDANSEAEPLPSEGLALEERGENSEQIAQKDAEISKLLKQKQDRETNINRLKFQLSEFKQALERSESQKIDLENNLQLVQDVNAKKGKEDDNKVRKELKALTQELSQTRINAKEQLEAATQDAEEEKQYLLNEISKLTSELEETTFRINKAMEDSNAKKNKEIQTLSQQSRDLQKEIQVLKTQLQEVQGALVESEKLTDQLERQIVSLQEENEEVREAGKSLLQALKEQFQSEKDSLAQQLQSYSDQLKNEKQEKEEQLALVKAASSEEKKVLLAEIDALSAELEEVKVEIEKAKSDAIEARKEADKKVKRQVRKSRNLDRAVKEVAAKEKKIFKKQIWDLQSQKESAEFNLFSVQRERDELQASIKFFEKQIQELEASNLEQVDELENRLKADEMFYAQSKASSKKRMGGLVEKFQKKLGRRENRFKKDIEDLRLQLTNQFNSEKAKLNQQKKEEVENMRIEGEMNLSKAQDEFDAKSADLKQQMDVAKLKAEKKMSDMKATFESELKFERVEAKKQKDRMIAEKEKIENDARLAYDQLMKSMTNKLDKASEENASLRKTIDQKNALIEGYETERSSFRSLAKLTWKVTKGKITKRRGRKQ
jgi:chromosome segregation ATPase